MMTVADLKELIADKPNDARFGLWLTETDANAIAEVMRDTDLAGFEVSFTWDGSDIHVKLGENFAS